jgi:acetyltransferase
VSAEKYAHLSIVPYPEDYVSQPIMVAGQEVIFRPIKPEDEPLWLDLLKSCSRESIYSRFNYFFQWASHEVATRFCYIDYDREIAIVAEIVEDGQKKLIAVGRLIANIEHENVEYAVLITDKWQNKDLGGILTDYCLEISKKWGLKRVLAQTTFDNQRVISVFRKRNFKITQDKETSTVFFEKEIND